MTALSKAATKALAPILAKTAPHVLPGVEAHRRSFPAQPRVHRLGCAHAPDGVQITVADLRAMPGYYQNCCANTFSTHPVLVTAPEHPEHAYDPCMIWPGSCWRPVCRTCYGTHDGERAYNGTWPIGYTPEETR